MKKNNHQDGFTLIEVLIAVFMLTVGILGTIIMQTTAIEGNSTASHLSGGANWASDRQETLMALSYDDPALTDANADGQTGLNNTDTGNPADGSVVQGDYTIFWNIADNFPVYGTKTIRVIVRRSDKGVQKTVTLDFTKMRPI